MTNFQDALDHCQLSDMGFSGPRFTWSNRKTDYMFTKESLDRAVANNQFALRFPQLTVEVLAARSSDHAPLYVVLHQVSSSQRRTKSLFRYESWWQRQEGFTNAVRQVWIEKSSNRTPWGLLKGKIHRSTKVCQQWRKVHVDPID